MGKRSRPVAIYESDRFFFISGAFQEEDMEFQMLDVGAASTHMLKDGRLPVFVYPKNNFGTGGQAQNESVQKYVEGIIGDVGRFTLSSTIQPYSAIASPDRSAHAKK